MFSLNVVDTDKFLEMPISARLLYYELGMRADDDGFVDTWKKILMFTGLKEDDMKILIAKQFIIPFESGVVVIKHWRINNYIRKDMYHETNYKEEKALLEEDENGAYRLLVTNPLQTCTETETQNRLDKNRLDKNRLELIAPTSADIDAEVFDKMPCLENHYYTIHMEEVETYKKRFPAVDVEQELRNAITWIESNPKNRKTISGAKRFLTNWLIKAQNRSRAYSERNKSGVNYIDIE
jgi:hypothetical protein